MIAVALRGLAGRKLRTVLTALSIVLGTAMIAGTFVVRDQITSAFGTIFDESNKGTDVVLQKRTAFTADFESNVGPLPASLIETVRHVPGVQKAEGQVQASGSIVLQRGDDSQTNAIVFSSLGDPFDAALAYTSGGAPGESGEVAINRKLAEDKGLSVGDRIQLATSVGLRPVTVHGIFDFAGKASLNGSAMAVTTFADAQAWFDRASQASTIVADAEQGVSPKELRDRIRAAVPSYVDVETGDENAKDETNRASSGINDFLTPLLLAFAGVAVFVGAFIIFNTFSITVAQRTREYAMLRTVGASRR
jgi:putative ABC transport system permease protein